MKLKKKLFFLFLLIAAVQNFSFADDTAVLLRLKRGDQPDSLGCNFVEQVTKYVYALIMDNKVKLWDSQQKEIQITPASLKEIEKTSGTDFTQQEIFFIYEMWQNVKRGLISKTLGFTFFTKDSRGQEVSYGYVDFNELRPYFTAKIETNADGWFGETFMYFLSQKKFIYNLIQVNGHVLANVNESQEALNNFKGVLQFGSQADEEDLMKQVHYFIDAKSSVDSLKSANSKAIFTTFENHFNDFPEEFFNLGGDRLQNYQKGNHKIKVTGIEVTEFWKKINNQIIYEPSSVTIFVNDSALNALDKMQLLNLDVNINDKRFIVMLVEKQFNLVITKINSQKIARKDAYLYFKAMQTYNWNQVMEYVKYY